MKKKLFLFSLIIALLFSTSANAEEKINAKSVLLMETDSGRILYSKNKDEVLPQASITKLMTYYVFKDFMKNNAVDENSIVTVKKWDVPEDGTKAGFKEGDKVSIKQLLNTLLVLSANDSALQLEDIYNSNNGNIINDMNKKAQSLALSHTIYNNTSGLKENDIEENHTTAYETAKLAASVINTYPEILDITSQKEYLFNGKRFKNTNSLVKMMPGVDGLKTGHTDDAGYCVVSTMIVKAKDREHKAFRIISVVLGSDSDMQRFRDSETLLKFGEANYENEKVVDGDTVFRLKNDFYKSGFVDASTKKDIFLFKENNERIEKKVEFDNNLTKGIKKGEVIGKISVKNLDSGEMSENKLYATADFKPVSIFKRIMIYITRLIKHLR